MALRNVLLVCGIADIQNPQGNRPTQLFIASQGFVSLEDLSMLRIKDVPHMIKDHNSVPNQAARLGAVQQRKLQALIWWAKDRERRGIPIIAADWTPATLATSITQINIDAPGGDTKVAHPGKVATGHNWTTWDIKWENYLGSMLGSSGVPLDYVTRRDMPAEWTAGNEHDALKYQAIQVGPAWEADKMTVYAELKACCLDGEGWAWIKAYDRNKDGREATANLRAHYEGDGEVNKRVAWATANIANAHYTSEHTYSFERFSTVLQEAFTILNDNGETHSGGQMVRKLLEKMNVPNNSEMDACKRICSNTHGNDFVAAVAYLSGQVTELFPNAQLDNKKKRKVSEVNGGRGRGRGGGGRGRGRGRFQRGGHGAGRGGRGSDPERDFTTFHGINIQDVTRDFTSTEWDDLKADGRAYINRLRNRDRPANRGGGRGRGNDDARGRGRGGRQVAEAATERAEQEPAGGRGGRGAQNGSRFGGGAY
jgi:hypothetical protein